MFTIVAFCTGLTCVLLHCGFRTSSGFGSQVLFGSRPKINSADVKSRLEQMDLRWSPLTPGGILTFSNLKCGVLQDGS